MTDPFPSMSSWIESSMKLNKRMPNAEELALWGKVSVEDARKALEEYTPSKKEPPKAREEEKPKKWRLTLGWVLDQGAMWAAIGVDIVFNMAGFWIIAYDPVSKVAFVVSASVVVLFALRAWIKGRWYGKALWFVFAVIATFMDVSLALASTEAQAKTVSDSQKIALERKVQDDEAYVQSLRALQIQKGEGYKSQIDNAIAQANESRRRVQDFRSEVPVISSDNIFNAIGNASVSGRSERIVALILFSLLFGGFQLTIISAASKIKA